MFAIKGPVVYAERFCCFSPKVLMFFMNRMLKGNADTSREFLDTIESFRKVYPHPSPVDVNQLIMKR